jgi:hypothetical protein
MTPARVFRKHAGATLFSSARNRWMHAGPLSDKLLGKLRPHRWIRNFYMA